jgi:hypothetical protein
VKPDVVARNTLYVTPAVVDAVHERLIPTLDAAVAVRFVGEAGGGAACVVAVAWLDAGEAPPAFTASTT